MLQVKKIFYVLLFTAVNGNITMIHRFMHSNNCANRYHFSLEKTNAKPEILVRIPVS